MLPSNWKSWIVEVVFTSRPGAANDQAMIVCSEPRAVFRYDDAHSYPGHGDNHHRHGVNYADWTYLEPPQWIGHDRWPLLSEVIDELHQWRLTTGRQLRS